jgi:Ser/Thr protein kinase RdoA (MazF antagonist)
MKQYVVGSPQRNLVEPIDDGADSRFMAVAWTKATGEMPTRDTADPSFWHAHGTLFGRIHEATARFTRHSRSSTSTTADTRGSQTT